MQKITKFFATVSDSSSSLSNNLSSPQPPEPGNELALEDQNKDKEDSKKKRSGSMIPVKNKKNKHVQKSRECWKNDPMLKSWILFDEENDCKIRCRLCKNQLMAKYSVLMHHIESRKHILLAKTDPCSLVAKSDLSRYLKKPLKLKKNIQTKEARIALFIAENCSFIKTETVVNILKNICQEPSTTKIKLGKTKCIAIIKNVFGEHFKQLLINNMADAKFSLMIDESTDVSVNKYLGLSIIYFDKEASSFNTTFLKLAELESCDANGIVQAILHTLKEFNLKIENLMGIGTDNASVMVGVNRGVHKKLLQHNAKIVLVRCVCHSLVLAVSHASKLLPQKLEYLVSETYNWFSKSSERINQYNKIYKLINNGLSPKKINEVSNTRWLSIEVAISRILDQWLELKTTFQICKNSCHKAKVLWKIYDDESHLIYLMFLKNILDKVQRVNKMFEALNADKTKLFNELCDLISELLRIFSGTESNFNCDDFSTLNFENNFVIENFNLNSDIKLLLTKQPLKAQDEIKKDCWIFLKDLLKQLVQRLPTNIAVLKFTSNFSAANVLSQKKKGVREIVQSFEPDSRKVQKILDQWQHIVYKEWSETNDTTKLWIEIFNYRDALGENPFQEISNFVISLLVLPYSNAEIERLFSIMNVIKNKKRNKMQLNTLNSVLYIKYGLKRLNKRCYEYPIDKKLLKLISSNEKYNKGDQTSQEESDTDEALLLDLQELQL